VSGGGSGANYGEGSTQIAKSGGGGFCPKPDEVSLEDLPVAKDWRAQHGFGVWWELSKTEPAPLSVGAGKPFDLYLNVQAFYSSRFCEEWAEPVPPGETVRLIFRPAARNLAVSGHADAPVTEKTADRYNAVFRGITASDGLIDVYVYENSFDMDGNPIAPPADDTAFVADTARTHYLGSFATKVSVIETIRDQMQQVGGPSPF
jgi:hypothetical protein